MNGENEPLEKVSDDLQGLSTECDETSSSTEGGLLGTHPMIAPKVVKMSDEKKENSLSQLPAMLSVPCPFGKHSIMARLGPKTYRAICGEHGITMFLWPYAPGISQLVNPPEEGFDVLKG